MSEQQPMDAAGFFAEAKRLNLRAPMSHADMCAAFDAKDAEIAQLRAELSRLQAENEALRDSVAAKADRIDRLGEIVERLQAAGGQGVVAWRYELATYFEGDLRGRGWQWRMTDYKPNAPPSMIRNLTPLYAHPPAAPALVPLTDEQIVDGLNLPEYKVALFAGTNPAFTAGVKFAEKSHGINGLTVGDAST